MSEAQTTEALHLLMSLFEGELAEVPFPDVGVETLRAARDAVDASLAEVRMAEEALANARASLEQAQRGFERTGRKALAYARVYAEDDAELGQRLSEVASMLTAPTSTAPILGEAPRKRGRPRKTEVDLFGSELRAQSAEMEEAASA